MTSSPALEILLTSARALASGDSLEATLDALLGVVANELGIASAAVFVADQAGGLSIAASIGVGDAKALAAAVRDPTHPVSRTMVEQASMFDVKPRAPGGPALRTHLPLMISRNGSQAVLGVLALAYDHPTDPETRSTLEAVGDLVAVAIERDRGRRA